MQMLCFAERANGGARGIWYVESFGRGCRIYRNNLSLSIVSSLILHDKIAKSICTYNARPHPAVDVEGLSTNLETALEVAKLKGVITPYLSLSGLFSGG